MNQQEAEDVLYLERLMRDPNSDVVKSDTMKHIVRLLLQVRKEVDHIPVSANK